MNINFELYRIFYVVANCGNITKAANELMISQPAVTKQIKTLESQLGGELFIRTKRGVILTDSGKEIYNYIKQGMNYFEAAELKFNNLKEVTTGVLRIGCSTTLCRIFLLKYLEKFHKEYPNVAIQLFTDPSRIMRKMLKDGSLDILIAKEDIIEDSDLDVFRLGKLHQCFIASDKYKKLKGKVINLKELDKYPLLFQKYPSTSRQAFDKLCKDLNIEMSTKLEIASSTLLEDFVKAGFGIGLVTKEYAQNEIDNGSVFEVKTTPTVPPKYFSLITLKKSFHSFAANKFIEMIQNDKKN